MFFHDFAMGTLVGITGLVLTNLLRAQGGGFSGRGLLEHQGLERVWTVLPAFLLVQLAAPSLVLLYTLDEVGGRALSLKAVGHQWYWRYEYADFQSEAGEGLEFDSYLRADSEGRRRLLDVDNAPALPVGVKSRVLTRSRDVLHA